MSSMHYLWLAITPLAIIGFFVYSHFVRKKVLQAVAEGKGPILFHNGVSGPFKDLQPNEFIIAVWHGMAFAPEKTLGQKIGKAVVEGLTRTVEYVPYVQVAVTSWGRLHIAGEHSEFNRRGYFHTEAIYPPGTIAICGPQAAPQFQGKAPKNPFNSAIPLQLTLLRAPDGASFLCWLSTQSVEVTGRQVPIDTILPVTAESAQAAWNAALQQAQSQRGGQQPIA